MQQPWSREAVARRVRDLIHEHDQDDLGAAALRLGVTESALREILDPALDEQNLGTLGALIRGYGVDGAWLLTGHADLASPAVDRDARVHASDLLFQIARESRERH